jgi:hypothetical protein
MGKCDAVCRSGQTTAGHITACCGVVGQKLEGTWTRVNEGIVREVEGHLDGLGNIGDD